MSEEQSIKHRIFELLDKNPLLSAKMICKMLPLPFEQYGQYVRNCKYHWKCNIRSQRGLKGSVFGGLDVHNAFFVCRVPLGVDRVRAVGVGWVQSRSRNKFLLWRDVLGRVRWFLTGTVEMFVRKPASLGKAMQLFCNAFTKCELITDLKVLDDVAKNLHIRGFHVAFPTEQRLPYLKVSLFKDTNGVELILGDKTHPNSAELIVNYQEQVERVKMFFDELFNVSGKSRISKSGVEGLVV